MKLDVDVSHVIGLYSDLFPSEFRNQIEYPGKIPPITGQDLEKGYTALVEYLTEVRHKLEGNLNGYLSKNICLSFCPVGFCLFERALEKVKNIRCF